MPCQQLTPCLITKQLYFTVFPWSLSPTPPSTPPSPSPSLPHHPSHSETPSLFIFNVTGQTTSPCLQTMTVPFHVIPQTPEYDEAAGMPPEPALSDCPSSKKMPVMCHCLRHPPPKHTIALFTADSWGILQATADDPPLHIPYGTSGVPRERNSKI